MFHLDFTPPKLPVSITYDRPVIFMGSCFAEHIGEQMSRLKFNCTVNPLGIAYNPVSVLNLLKRCVEGNHFTPEDFQRLPDGRYVCFDLHSNLSHTDLNTAINKANQAIDKTLKQTDNNPVVIISLGTAFAFILTENGKLVNNCHKQPGQLFSRELLPITQIQNTLKDIITLLKKHNINDVIFTVSPIRHLRDGLIANNRSKGQLLAALHDVLETTPSASYFPSYEILIDQLRDYRFYNSDRVHPSDEAIQYIFDVFCNCTMDASTREQMNKIEKLLNEVNHRPHFPGTDEHQSRLQQLHQKLVKLQSNDISFQQEIDKISTQLKS